MITSPFSFLNYQLHLMKFFPFCKKNKETYNMTYHIHMKNVGIIIVNYENMLNKIKYTYT